MRSRLGYAKIDLFGLSYGTRLALAYMRTHPDRVRSAVLVGTLADGKMLPLWHARNAQSVLDALFDQCSSDAACHVYLSITCAEDTPLITAEERVSATAGTFLGTCRIDEQMAACRAWNVPRAPDPSWPAPHPDVPVLLIAGLMDAVTAPAWAREVAATLPRSRVIEIPALGHFPDGLDHPECFDAMMAAFYESPRPDKVDTACLTHMTRPGFVLQ